MTHGQNDKVSALKKRLAKLRTDHKQLKARIARERQLPAPCSLALQTLKRQKLRLKDEVTRCAELVRSREGQMSRQNPAV